MGRLYFLLLLQIWDFAGTKAIYIIQVVGLDQYVYLMNS